MLLARVEPERSLQDSDTFGKVRFFLDPVVHLGDICRELLPALLFGFEFESLKERVTRVFIQVLIADGEGFGQIAIRQVFSRFGVGILNSIMLGTNLVVEVLVSVGLSGGRRVRSA